MVHVHPSFACRRSICPPVLKRVNRIIREFLWHGHRDANAGHCLVNWQKVCRPLEYGGLGILDLCRFGIALRTRWCWLQRTDLSRPWVDLKLPNDPNCRAVLRASTSWVIGNGRSCLFWEDHWVDGQSIPDLAPNLAALVHKRRRKLRTVADGLDRRAWIRDIHGALTPMAIVEYIDLW